MKIQIVNDKDELIGAKERKDVNYETDIYRVSALWLTNSKGETLLARRVMTKDKDPGKWGPSVAGTVDEGETYEQNIYKEAMEEIGLEDVKFTKSVKMRFTDPRQCFIQWYVVTLDRDVDDFTMQAEEVDGLEWVDTQQLKEEVEINPDKYISGMKQIVGGLGL